MLESLKFEIGGFPNLFTYLKIKVKEQIVYYQVQKSIDKEPTIEGKLSVEESISWLNKLDLVHINLWSKSYSDDCICDGTQWSVKYKEVGGKKLTIEGSNSFPDVWYKLVPLINQFDPNEKIINFIDILALELRIHSNDSLINSGNFKNTHQISSGKNLEKFVIDRGKRRILHTINDAKLGSIKQEYLLNINFDYILEDCGSNFIGIESINSTEYTRPYVEVIIKHLDNKKEKFKFNYNRVELPPFWGDMMTKLSSFCSNYNSNGILFDPKKYNHGVKENEFIYCKVKLEYSNSAYYYLSEDPAIKVGDNVTVAVGNDNNFKEAKVIKVEYFEEANVPYPLEKMRKILEII